MMKCQKLNLYLQSLVFNEFSKEELEKFLVDNGMAMNYDDLKVTQDYFKNEEKRDPTETELKVLDTYWSDHCRHTTFATVITDLDIENGAFKEILEKDIENYKTSRHLVYGIDTKRPLNINGFSDYFNERIT